MIDRDEEMAEGLDEIQQGGWTVYSSSAWRSCKRERESRLEPARQRSFCKLHEANFVDL